MKYLFRIHIHTLNIITTKKRSSIAVEPKVSITYRRRCRLSLVSSSRFKVIFFINRKSLDSCSSFLFALNSHISHLSHSYEGVLKKLLLSRWTFYFVPSAYFSQIFRYLLCNFFSHFSEILCVDDFLKKNLQWNIFFTYWSKKQITGQIFVIDIAEDVVVDCHQNLQVVTGNRSQRRDH